MAQKVSSAGIIGIYLKFRTYLPGYFPGPFFILYHKPFKLLYSTSTQKKHLCAKIRKYKIWKSLMSVAEEISAHERCTRQLVPNVAKSVKYPLSLQKEEKCIVVTAIERIEISDS
tara:strand:- start:2018 stop:2362 length:345 start_codon:yes stop_codon:yes gene_type:complete